METTTEKRFSPQMRRMLGTRQGTLWLAGGVAVLAALVLAVFLSQYRDSVRGGTAPTTALVAGSLIPKGSSGDTVIDQQLFKPTALAEDQLVDDALLDTAALAGKVATRDIYPGQQIAAADFAAKADPVRGQLTGDQRAISVPLDGAHGLIGEIRSGDRVDVMAGFNTRNSGDGTGSPVIKTLMQNVLILSVPEDADRSSNRQGRTSNLTVRVTDRGAAQLAFAADNGKVWFVLRPPAGASQQKPSTVELEGLLSGSAPIETGADR
jgi:Flp pilus assembly protein CpaB